MTEPTSARWEWRYADDAGVAMPGPELTFDSQQEAEDWLGQHFEELAGSGVLAVSLFDGERIVYGPMSLAPAD